MVTRRVFIGGISGTALLAAARVYANVSDLTDITISEASMLIRARMISPVDLARAYLARIERLDPRVNSYITVTSDLALDKGTRGPDAKLCIAAQNRD